MNELNNYLDRLFQNVSDWSLDGGDYYLATIEIIKLLCTVSFVLSLIGIIWIGLIRFRENRKGWFNDIVQRRLVALLIIVINSVWLWFVYFFTIMLSSFFYSVDDYARETLHSKLFGWYIGMNLLPLVLLLICAFAFRRVFKKYQWHSVFVSNNKILGLF